MKKILFVIAITMSLSNVLNGEGLSARKAIMGSAIIPGYGQFYTGNLTKAGIHLTSEILIISSYLKLGSEIDNVTRFYKQYAQNYADVQGRRPDAYYQMIQNYRSSESYNSQVILAARNWFLIYRNDPESYYAYLENNLISPEDAWEWRSDRHWQFYRNKRNDKQQMEIYRNFAIGAAVLNRIISIIDSAVTVNRINRTSSIISNFYFTSDFTSKSLRLNYTHRF